MRACLDMPVNGQVCDPFCIRIEGWALGPERDLQMTSVEVWEGSNCVGRTDRWFVRPDVSQAFTLASDIRPGFAVAAFFATPSQRGTRAVQLRFLRDATLVGTLDATYPTADITAVPRGSPLPNGKQRTEFVALAARTLAMPGARLVEFACESGLYGRKLCAAGFLWHGLETRAEFSPILAASGLPHTMMDAEETPFRDGGFDVAVVINARLTGRSTPSLLVELKRIAPHALIASVPRTQETHSDAAADHSDRLVLNEMTNAVFPYYSKVEILPYNECRAPTLGTPPHYGHWFFVAKS